MKNIVKMEQVHGNNVVLVSAKDIGKTIKECDGLITNSPDVTLRISVADCLPIFLSDNFKNAIGLTHAGWRGLDNKIIEKTVGLMKKKFNTKSEDLNIYIGSHICQKHYEIKADVSGKFKLYPKALHFKGLAFKGRRTFLDLGEVAKQQFIELGVKEKNIKIDKECTYENKKLKSYRRGDKIGRSVYLFKLNV